MVMNERNSLKQREEQKVIIDCAKNLYWRCIANIVGPKNGPKNHIVNNNS